MDAQRAMIFRFQEDQELQEKYRSLNEERMELVQRLEQEALGKTREGRGSVRWLIVVTLR